MVETSQHIAAAWAVSLRLCLREWVAAMRLFIHPDSIHHQLLCGVGGANVSAPPFKETAPPLEETTSTRVM